MKESERKKEYETSRDVQAWPSLWDCFCSSCSCRFPSLSLSPIFNLYPRTFVLHLYAFVKIARANKNHTKTMSFNFSLSLSLSLSLSQISEFWALKQMFPQKHYLRDFFILFCDLLILLLFFVEILSFLCILSCKFCVIFGYLLFSDFFILFVGNFILQCCLPFLCFGKRSRLIPPFFGFFSFSLSFLQCTVSTLPFSFPFVAFVFKAQLWILFLSPSLSLLFISFSLLFFLFLLVPFFVLLFFFSPTIFLLAHPVLVVGSIDQCHI